MIRVTVETHPHERYDRTKNMQCQQNWWLELFLTLLNQQITTSTVGFTVSANRVKTLFTPCIVPKKWKVCFPIDKWSFLKQNKMDWFGQASARSAFPLFYLFFLKWHSRPWRPWWRNPYRQLRWIIIPKKVSASKPRQVLMVQGKWETTSPKKPYKCWSQRKILAKKCQVCLILIVAVALIVQPTISRLWIMNHIGKL